MGLRPPTTRSGALCLAYGKPVVIEGHTDGIGADDYNLDLSQRRADAVKEYLVGVGVPADRVSTIGMGEREPIGDNDTPEGQQENRRVVVKPAM